MSDSTPILPAHIEDTVRAIARLHAEHHARATPLQKLLETLTARAGRASFIPLVTMVVVAWITLNLALTKFKLAPIDGPPFGWLQGAIGLAALYMTALILTTQRREDQLASHREQLTLELGILSEQKAAKIIQLLEELRRDNPMIADRVDVEAEALSTPADPEAVLEAIKTTQEDAAALQSKPTTTGETMSPKRESEIESMPETGHVTYIAAESMRGAALYDRAGHKLGAIKELYLHPVTGHVAYVLGAAGGFLGVGGKYHPLPWSQLAPRAGNDGYVANFTKSDLENAPAYDQEQLGGAQYGWSDHVDQYFAKLSGTHI